MTCIPHLHRAVQKPLLLTFSLKCPECPAWRFQVTRMFIRLWFALHLLTLGVLLARAPDRAVFSLKGQVESRRVLLPINTPVGIPEKLSTGLDSANCKSRLHFSIDTSGGHSYSTKTRLCIKENTKWLAKFDCFSNKLSVFAASR